MSTNLAKIVIGNERFPKPDDGLLVVEFLRRMANWEKVLDTNSESPFFDVSQFLGGALYAKPPIELANQQFFDRLSLPAQRACIWQLNWEALPSQKIKAVADLPSPYIPIVTLLSSGGRFRIEDVFIDIGNASIPWSGWRDLAE